MLGLGLMKNVPYEEFWAVSNNYLELRIVSGFRPPLYTGRGLGFRGASLKLIEDLITTTQLFLLNGLV